MHSSWKSVFYALSIHWAVTVVLLTADGAKIRVRRPTAPEPDYLEKYKRQ